MNVMNDIICVGSVKLQGTRIKPELQNEKFLSTNLSLMKLMR